MEAWQSLQDLSEGLGKNGRNPFLMNLQKSGFQTHTYAELSQASRRLARGLIQEGIRPGHVVGFFAPLGSAWIAACVAALRAGAVVMPLDPQLEPETLAGILEDSDPGLIFTDAKGLASLGRAPTRHARPVLLDGSGRGEPRVTWCRSGM